VIRAARAEGVVFVPDDKLELNITLYLDDADLRYHDVDNRLKDIMDALQGRVGGLKSKRQLEPIIPNDHQVFKVTIEKMPSPAQSHVMGPMIIKKYKPIAVWKEY
jgi:Holliday junction resolvase RusA-like endonuclease